MTIEFKKTKVGDILKIVGAGAPGWAKLGDIVRVVEVFADSVTVEDKGGDRSEFSFNCGAE